MSEWFETTADILTKVWDTLDRGVIDADHPARRPTLATVSPDGWPEARTVVLRSADRTGGVVTVHTDLYSDKIKSLQPVPRAALHIWDVEQNLQIRLQAEVAIARAPETRTLWDEIPDHAQQSYGVTPPPGTPIETALDYVKQPDPETFAVLHCTIIAIDALHLGADHRRVSYSRVGHWQGQWLSP
ncbi:pyridoxamine 5'-phosphate oxidase family protein [Yoonia sp. GPGPB17]|uniref:pyridoxamine 5'-phosphate oxidase family protein n=1 Tax=Yoonia sp. GPGPB17 TaxID=3026147 RepID=UPI0030BF8556